MGEWDEWKGNKKQRDTLRQKFGGRCAYCGCELTDMHADHLEPVVRLHTDPWGKPLPHAEKSFLKPERNVVSNMMPACAPCNLHKGGYPLEFWRNIIQRSGEIVRNQTSTFKAGERFGVIRVSADPVTFYFEKLTGNPTPQTLGIANGDEPKTLRAKDSSQ